MSEPHTLVDGPARHQIATDVASRLAVNAAAGSGKTTALVDRIVTLVARHGTPMSSIAAITFTEAAAAELRVRVRRALEAGARDDPRLAKAAREVDDAAICTIHAFARRILSENWLEAGLTPNIEVLDAAGEYLDHKTRWAQFTSELLADQAAAPALMRGFASGLRLGQLREVARALAQHHDRLTPPVLARLELERVERADPRLDVRGAVERIRAAIALKEHCTDDSDRLHHHLRTVMADALGQLEPLVGSDDETTLLSVLRTLPRLTCSFGQRDNWSTEVRDVRAACSEAQDACDTIRSAVALTVVTELGYRLTRWAVEGAAQRRAEGRFSFHDLLVEARTLLRDNDPARARVRERYRCVLIDEFQDTDPLQAELAGLLGEPEARDAAARLFLVGDPEQSIYRFRRADVAQFTAAVAAMDEEITLASNFRSVPEILRFVDAVFEGLGEEVAKHDGIAHRSLVATRGGDAHEAGPTVGTFGGPDDELRAREVRMRSTEDVAAIAGAAVRERWTVHEADGRRAARYSDVAVLLPTRTSLPMLERAFDAADVPYRLEGASLVWASQDVRDVLAVARAVHDPANPIAVVAALRTPGLACGDDDLVRFHARGASWDPRAEVDGAPGADDPVARGMAVLAELHDRGMWMSPSEMISAIVTDLRFFELALVHRRPRDHWQRLRWLEDQARAFEEAGGGTLGEFLEWVDLSEEAERWTSTLGAPEPDDDAVRVMTVHGAKGLEFPIVVLTGLDTPPPNIVPPVLFDAGGMPRFSFGVDFRSPDYKALWDADRSLEAAERLRLLYVALTRPRDHLVVDLGHKATATEALATKLFFICEAAGVDRITPAPAIAPVRPEAPARAEGARWWVEQARWQTERDRLVAESARQPTWSATALAAAGSTGERRWPAAAGHDEEEIRRRVGRAVHDALAKIALTVDGELSEAGERIARGAAAAQRLDPAVSETVVALVRWAIASPLVRSLAAGRHWKELPLAAPLPGGGLLEGFADLVGESAEGLVVVDFKTAPRGAASPQYLGQVAAYAYLLERSTHEPVARVAVCYLDEAGSEEETLEGEALEAKIADVLRAAGADAPSADAADSGQLSLFGAP